MNKLKFFRFTIEGDELNPNEIKSIVSLPAEIFLKGDKLIKEYNKKYVIEQKTNRWVYSSEVSDDLDINLFLSKNLKEIICNIDSLTPYINNFLSKIELIIYAGDETDLVITKDCLELLNHIGVNIHISFC